jgi:hypothetical protein
VIPDDAGYGRQKMEVLKMDEQVTGPKVEKGDTRQAVKWIEEELGLIIAVNTLAKYRCVGGGPEFELWGRTPIYTKPSTLRWARARLSKPRQFASEPQDAA